MVVFLTAPLLLLLEEPFPLILPRLIWFQRVRAMVASLRPQSVATAAQSACGEEKVVSFFGVGGEEGDGRWRSGREGCFLLFLGFGASDGTVTGERKS